MSEDYDTDEINVEDSDESSGSEYSTADTDCTTVDENNADRRAYHNQLERQRRDNLKSLFCNLRDSVPYYKKQKKNGKSGVIKASRVEIMDKASEYIRSEELKHSQAVEIDRENQALQSFLAKAQKALASGDKAAKEEVLKSLPVTKEWTNFSDSWESDSSSSDSEAPPLKSKRGTLCPKLKSARRRRFR